MLAGVDLSLARRNLGPASFSRPDPPFPTCPAGPPKTSPAEIHHPMARSGRVLGGPQEPGAWGRGCPSTHSQAHACAPEGARAHAGAEARTHAHTLRAVKDLE